MDIIRGQRKKDLAFHVMEFELNYEENRKPKKKKKRILSKKIYSNVSNQNIKKWVILV